jgi:hypothetical protein
MTKPGGIILFLCLVASWSGIAQVRDAQLWMNAEVNRKITPDLTAGIAQEVRIEENITEAGSMLTDAFVHYRLNKRFRIGAAYRFSMKRRVDDSYALRHGWFTDVTFREEVSRLSMKLRLRFQSRYAEDFYSGETGLPESHLRAKLTLKTDPGIRLQPYITGEMFFKVNGRITGSFDQYRISAGVEYPLSRMHSIDLSYKIAQEVQVNKPDTRYVIELGYIFTF